MAIIPPTKKLGGYDFYNNVLGSPKYIVAPMVDQSELAWRRLSRRYGAQVIYSPMINAKMFNTQAHKTYRDNNFNITCGEEGDPTIDRPLVVQFCANDPDQLLASAKIIEPYCDAVDINLGCPQDIAKKGKYGAFLQDDWDLIYKLINTLHTNLSIPVTAKFRVFPTVEKTVAYARMLERAGAQILTCHGRIREQRGVNTGLADWTKIRAVKEAVSVPVFANGNILYQSDIFNCLNATGADSVMSAEGQLYNPALFNGLTAMFTPSSPSTTLSLPPSHPDYLSDEQILLRQPRHCDLAIEYLDIVLSQKTPTTVSAVKGHLFKIMRPGLTREKDLRERLGKTRVNPKAPREGYEEYMRVCKELKERMERDEKAAAGKSLKDLMELESVTGIQVMPHWLAQPYFRPPPPPKPEPESKKSTTPAKRPHIETEPATPNTDGEEAKRVKLDGVQTVEV
ncbi:Dus-domain-containing protein [Macrolepiota fuliginosa MF-IS2]|uniref:tRNA-dihydrouridine(16/17) synthase [NAD(P)(+)] n=1 Tax=Macrolepiota fuliginosa MF-IS2 TaxID=1400762 RepID=A0A9P5X378_9AGAR|nr:Dus-domain-containing protein [Macrolepiota fuliginosa MF-IS2]